MINEGEGGSPSSMAPPRKVSKQEAIVEVLSREIAEGTYSAETQLPTEAELCARFGASCATVREALRQLADAGLVASVRGQGWYVRNDPRHRFPLLIADDHGVLQRDNDAWRNWLRSQELTATYELTVSIGLPPRHVTEHLGIEPDAECVTRRRLRFLDGEPVMLSTGYFPRRLNDGTPLAEGTEFARTGSGEKVKHEVGALVTLISLGHVPVSEEDHIGARMPDP